MSLYAAIEIVLKRFWDYRDLVILSGTCHLMRQMAARLIAGRIESYLSLWVTSYPEFWLTLEELKGVIGGAFVLRVLDNTVYTWTPRSLDIYLAGPTSCRAMKMALERHGYTDWIVAGYRRVPRHTKVGDRFVWSKGTVVHSIHEAHLGPRVIRLYSTDHIDALSAIPNNWSTLFINAITADRLLCAYPRTTLVREGLISPGSWGMVSFRGLCQCIGSGFRVHGWDDGRSGGSRLVVQHGYRADDLRSLGDEKSLCVRFDTSVFCDGVRSDTFGDTRARLTSWQYEPRSHGERYALRQEWLEGDLT